MLETGIRREAKEVVSESNSAQAMKSGELKVYATPSMIALMEQAAYKSVAEIWDTFINVPTVPFPSSSSAATLL